MNMSSTMISFSLSFIFLSKKNNIFSVVSLWFFFFLLCDEISLVLLGAAELELAFYSAIRQCFTTWFKHTTTLPIILQTGTSGRLRSCVLQTQVVMISKIYIILASMRSFKNSGTSRMLPSYHSTPA